ncbi:FecR domain-containing protein [bacterium]|nr:FecR domain-containing protein [bacterium]
MKRSFSTILVLFLINTFLISCSQNTLILTKGSITVTQGEVTKQYDTPNSKVALSKNQQVKTGNNTRLIVNLKETGDTIELYSNAQILLPEIVAKDAPQVYFIPEGKARFIVKKSTDSKTQRSITVRTSTALIGIKGTDFVISSSGNSTKLLTMEGLVALSNAEEPEKEVIVAANQVSKVDKGFLPTRPVKVPAAMIDKILAEDEVGSLNNVPYGKTIGVLTKKIATAAPRVRSIGNAIKLSWLKEKGVDFYNLYWSNSANVSPQIGHKIDRLTDSFLHKNLTLDKEYYYILTPVIKGLEGIPSPVAVAKPILSLQAPQNLVPVRQMTSVSLEWDRVENAEGYYIYWNIDQKELTNADTPIKVTGNGYTHLNLDKDKTYYYAIQAFNGDLLSPFSQVREVARLKEPVPGIPGNPKVEVGSGAVFLQWDKAAHATGYTIYWSTEKEDLNDTKAKKIQVKKNQFLHDELDNGTTYYYSISGINKDEEGKKTEVLQATPQIWLSIIKFFKDLRNEDENSVE